MIPINNSYKIKSKMNKKQLLLFSSIILFLIWFVLIKVPSNKLKPSFSEDIFSSKSEDLSIWQSICQSAEKGNNLPIIYAITPTYERPVQQAELTRLSHTLRLVPKLHWIVVEDASSKSLLVGKLLFRSGLHYTHLNAQTPKNYKLKESNWKMPRGVAQRNAALQWLRDNLNADKDEGVVYFADDDNSYTLEIFEEMRTTQHVTVWPVGLSGGLLVERPILDPISGKVVSFNAAWHPQRLFPIDMAGFAINLGLLLRTPHAKFSYDLEPGLQETEILKYLVVREKLEPRASNCTRVLVWHTRTEKPNLIWEKDLAKKGKSSMEGMEL